MTGRIMNGFGGGLKRQFIISVIIRKGEGDTKHYLLLLLQDMGDKSFCPLRSRVEDRTGFGGKDLVYNF